MSQNRFRGTLLTTAEVAGRLGSTSQHVRNCVKSGILAYPHVYGGRGKSSQFKLSDVKRAISRGAIPSRRRAA